MSRVPRGQEKDDKPPCPKGEWKTAPTSGRTSTTPATRMPIQGNKAIAHAGAGARGQGPPPQTPGPGSGVQQVRAKPRDRPALITRGREAPHRRASHAFFLAPPPHCSGTIKASNRKGSVRMIGRSPELRIACGRGGTKWKLTVGEGAVSFT